LLGRPKYAIPISKNFVTMESKSGRLKNVACNTLCYLLFDNLYASKFVHVAEIEFPAHCLCFRKSEFQRRSKPASSVRAFNCRVGGTALQALVLRFL
jgi:hypothetical protein